jgi:hypothetical protein
MAADFAGWRVFQEKYIGKFIFQGKCKKIYLH